jgi:putative ABC transport system permease protein
MVLSMDAGVSASASNRLVVQSAVSLFVDLPLSYQSKIEAVDGVVATTKFQWFGGYYREEGNFFAQFAVDHEKLLELYTEIELTDGSADAFKANRIGCLIGEDVARRFSLAVGDPLPVTGTIFAKKTAWEFKVEGIYRSSSANVDNNTMFFHFDYLEETLESGDASGPRGCGTFMIEIAPGTTPERIMREVDELFTNGPQRVTTTTEAEFQRQFVSMIGGLPKFIAGIGSGVLFAIVLAALNTMLMASRERTGDLGILKALGFSDASASLLLLLESLLLCAAGGAVGVGLALLSSPILGKVLSMVLPNFTISGETVGLALGLSLLIGLVAGAIPAYRASRLRVVEALRSER